MYLIGQAYKVSYWWIISGI